LNASQGHYEWIVVPFSLKNALQIFQRRMDNISKDLNHRYVVCVDYIIVFSNTIEQHKDDDLVIPHTCV